MATLTLQLTRYASCGGFLRVLGWSSVTIDAATRLEVYEQAKVASGIARGQGWCRHPLKQLGTPYAWRRGSEIRAVKVSSDDREGN